MALLVDWGAPSEERRRLVQSELCRITEALGAAGARRVWLFGSHARGEAKESSDLDLLVVMPRPPGEPVGARAAELARLVVPRVALDLIVYTPEEFDELRGRTPLLDDALAEGRLLLERD